MEPNTEEEWRSRMFHLSQCSQGYLFEIKESQNVANEILLEIQGQKDLSEAVFVSEARLEFRKWRLDESSSHPPFSTWLQPRAERLILSYELQGVKLPYLVFKAMMSKLRMLCEEDLRDDVSLWFDRPEKCEKLTTQMREKIDHVRADFMTHESLFLTKFFVFPMPNDEVNSVLQEHTLYTAYKVLGWGVLKDRYPNMSTCKMACIVIKGFLAPRFQ